MNALVPGSENCGFPADSFSIQGLLLVSNMRGIVEAHRPKAGGLCRRQEFNPLQWIGRLSNTVFPKDVALYHTHPVPFYQPVAFPLVNAKPGKFHFDSFLPIPNPCSGTLALTPSNNEPFYNKSGPWL